MYIFIITFLTLNLSRRGTRLFEGVYSLLLAVSRLLDHSEHPQPSSGI